VNGGSVYEAMNDLIAIMGSLTDKDGKILVPGINDNVAPVAENMNAFSSWLCKAYLSN